MAHYVTTSPFYRVATRALIFDDHRRLLVMENHDGETELPGGGWDYDESFAQCLGREIEEELGVAMASCGEDIVCVYRGMNSHGNMSLRLAVRATLTSYDFKPVDMMRAYWVTQQEFRGLNLVPAGEEEVKRFAEQIWAT